MGKNSQIGLENSVTTRLVRADDAKTVAVLSASLGYPASEDDIRSRIQQLAEDNERTTLVAVLQDEVVGWVDAAVERHLQSEAVVVIGGLVVRNDMRGRRIGQQLCRAVEQWAMQIGIATVRVRSQLRRTDAHRFYSSRRVYPGEDLSRLREAFTSKAVIAAPARRTPSLSPGPAYRYGRILHIGAAGRRSPCTFPLYCLRRFSQHSRVNRYKLGYCSHPAPLNPMHIVLA